jgi:uncharacterized protein YegL
MSDFEQKPYLPVRAEEEAGIFVGNPDPRCPVILVLDRSGSMDGEPIRELNAGLQLFCNEIRNDPLAARRIEVAILSFGPVTADVDFVSAERFAPPSLTAGGETPTGRALEVALNMISSRKETYKRNGIAYYRPWIFLITDGRPTDAWQHAAERIREGEKMKSFAFFAIGVSGADFDILRRLSVREPLQLDGLKFGSLFLWLSQSLAAVSRSQPGTDVSLPTPSGWARI